MSEQSITNLLLGHNGFVFVMWAVFAWAACYAISTWLMFAGRNVWGCTILVLGNCALVAVGIALFKWPHVAAWLVQRWRSRLGE